MAELYDPSERFRSDLNTLAQSFIAGMQAKKQKEMQEQDLALRKQQMDAETARQERLAKAAEAQNQIAFMGQLGKGISEGYYSPESADIINRRVSPELYPDIVTPKPVSEILPATELPPIVRPTSRPLTGEQEKAAQQSQVLRDRLNNVDNLPVPEQIKANLRDYLTTQLEQNQRVIYGEPSQVENLWETAPRGGIFNKPLQMRPAGTVEERTPAPNLFQTPGGVKKTDLPFVKETFQTITKLLENENLTKEEGSKFMESLPAFMKSGDISDLYIPSQIGENASKKERLFLENLRLQQQINASKTAEELMRARMAQMAGETPGAKLEDIMAKARAATLGREQAKAEVSLQQTGNIAGNLSDVLGFFNKIPQEYRGPSFGGTVQAPIGTLLKTEPNLVAFEDSKRFFLANISRQFGGERGVLTDADVARVEKLLPTTRDTEESAKAKTGMIYNIVDREVKRAQSIAKLPITGLAGLNDQTYSQLMDATRKGATKTTVPQGTAAPQIKASAIPIGTKPKPNDPATTKYLQENFPQFYPGGASALPGSPVLPQSPTETPAQGEPPASATEEMQADEIENLRQEMESYDLDALLKAASGQENE